MHNSTSSDKFHGLYSLVCVCLVWVFLIVLIALCVSLTNDKSKVKILNCPATLLLFLALPLLADTNPAYLVPPAGLAVSMHSGCALPGQQNHLGHSYTGGHFPCLWDVQRCANRSLERNSSLLIVKRSRAYLMIWRNEK